MVPSSVCFRPLLKHRILVKAQLGKSVLADMQKFQDEEEQCCSSMWHQVALCAGNITQQLTCYQKSITCLLVMLWHHLWIITQTPIHQPMNRWIMMSH